MLRPRRLRSGPLDRVVLHLGEHLDGESIGLKIVDLDVMCGAKKDEVLEGVALFFRHVDVVARPFRTPGTNVGDAGFHRFPVGIYEALFTRGFPLVAKGADVHKLAEQRLQGALQIADHRQMALTQGLAWVNVPPISTRMVNKPTERALSSPGNCDVG